MPPATRRRPTATPGPTTPDDGWPAGTGASAPGVAGAAGRPAGPASRVTRPVAAVSAVLVVLGVVCVAALTAAVVWTHLGQRADERSRWSIAVPDTVGDVLVEWLGTVSVGFVAAGLLACAVVAVVSGRWSRALAAGVLVAGANVSTQVLKAGIPRPSYGVGVGAGVDNSLPSGHTTVMVSLFLAAILVLPRAVRAPAVLFTSAAGTLTGAATIIQRWHRPSDVVAAVGVCAAWAGIGLLCAAMLRRTGSDRGAAARRQPRAPGRSRRWIHLLAGLAGAVVVGVYLVTGGLVPQGRPSNVVVGGVMLTALGAACAVVAALFAHGVDLLDGLDGLDGLDPAGRGGRGSGVVPGSA